MDEAVETGSPSSCIVPALTDISCSVAELGGGERKREREKKEKMKSTKIHVSQNYFQVHMQSNFSLIPRTFILHSLQTLTIYQRTALPTGFSLFQPTSAELQVKEGRQGW